MPGAQIDGEDDLFVSMQIPAQAFERIRIWLLVRDAQSLPAQALRLPGQTIFSQRTDRVKACEEQQPMVQRDKDTRHRPVDNLLPLFWLLRVDHKRIAPGHGAELLRIRAGPQAMRQRGSLKAQRKSSQKRRCIRRGDVQQQRAALDLLDGLRIHILPGRGNQRWVLQNLRLPGVGKGEIARSSAAR